MQLDGIHHITCITADAPANVDFYARVLGLRLVKKTVNFDAPDVYHLYYGDERGSPGSILTFFEFPDAAPGRAGAGMIHRLRWRVAPSRRSTSGPSGWQGEGVECDRAGDGARWRFSIPRAWDSSWRWSTATTSRWRRELTGSAPSMRCSGSTVCAPTAIAATKRSGC